MLGKNLHQRNPLAISTRVMEILISYLGFSSENEIYGNRKILCEYAGVDQNTKAMGRIQHGWVHDSLGRTLIRNRILDSYVWSKVAENFCKSNGITNIKAIGAPWLYLLKIMENFGWNIDEHPRGSRNIDELWIYGSHSVGIDAGTQNEGLDKFLDAANRSAGSKVFVLLYYTDFYSLNQNKRNHYKNIKIITALGARLRSSSSDAHLYVLFQILIQTKKIVLDIPTSALLYAISLGCEIEWYKSEEYTSYLTKAKIRGDADLAKIMENPNQSLKFLEAFIMNELGHESVKTAIALRRIFGWKKSGLSWAFRIHKAAHYFILVPFRIRGLKQQ